MEERSLVFADYSAGRYVYKLVDEEHRPFCRKIQPVFQSSSFLSALEIQQRLHHRSIVPVLSARTEESESGTTVIGEFPWAGESLEREMLLRAKDKKQWSEDECILLLDNIVDALAYAQSQGVSHGAVSPRCIFLTESSTFCISGFLGHTQSTTLSKSPMFFSPLRRRVYANKLLGFDNSDVQHDPYKSDVYSLGLIVLSLVLPLPADSFSNGEGLLITLESASISPELKAMLALTLSPLEPQRPDWFQLKKKMRESVETTFIRRINEAFAASCDLETMQRSLALLLKCSCEIRVSGAKQQLKQFPARAPPAAVTRHCKVCTHSFRLQASDKWRLELLGSSAAAAAKDCCSKACFAHSLSPIAPDAKSPAGFVDTRHTDLSHYFHSRSTVHLRFNVASQVLQNSQMSTQVIDLDYQYCGERFYYDCQVHQCEIAALKSYWSKVFPYLLAPCPQCNAMHRMMMFKDLYTISQKVWFAIVKDVELTRTYGHTATVTYTGDYYLPVSNQLCNEIFAGNCHFCLRLIGSNWRCLFHNGQPHLICSKKCAQKTLKSCKIDAEFVVCPTCQEPVALESVKAATGNADGYQSLLGCEVPGSCGVCVFGPGDIMLPCAHSLCRTCISHFLINPDRDEFPCLRCGVATSSSYLRGRK